MAELDNALRTFVEPGVEAPWLGEDDDEETSLVIVASRTTEQAVTDMDLNGKTITCMPINIKHGTAVNVTMFKPNFSNVRNGSTKRQKISNVSPYDRIVEFADLSDPGVCFVMIFKEQAVSRTMLKNVADIPAIGTPMLVGCPKKSNGYMTKSNLPIIEAEFPLVPLTREAEGYLIRNVIPAVPVRVPETPGELSYFVLHGQSITMQRFRITMDHVSCTGVTCDRKRILHDKNIACGCLNTGFDNKAMVAEATIKVPMPASADTSGVVQNFRSHRFTELVCENTKAMQKMDKKTLSMKYVKHQRRITALVQHVNTNEGWTTVGWFRRGESADASTENATMQSLEANMHLVLVVPTNGDIRNGRSETFNDLRLRAG